MLELVPRESRERSDHDSGRFTPRLESSVRHTGTVEESSYITKLRQKSAVLESVRDLLDEFPYLGTSRARFRDKIRDCLGLGPPPRFPFLYPSEFVLDIVHRLLAQSCQRFNDTPPAVPQDKHAEFEL